MGQSHHYRIREFISNSRYPFTSRQIMEELGICYETVKKYLQELTAKKAIRKIRTDKNGNNVYVQNQVIQSSHAQINKCGISQMKMVMNYIQQSAKYFTTVEIISATGLPYNSVTTCLLLLFNKSIITKLRLNNATNLYIRRFKKYKKDTNKNIDEDEIQRINEFVVKVTEPFTATQVAEVTNIPVKTTMNYLKELVLNGILKRTRGNVQTAIYKKTFPLFPKRQRVICGLYSSSSIMNFVQNATTPFTVHQIVEATELARGTVVKYFKELIAEEVVRLLGKDKGKTVYATVKHKANKNHYTIEYMRKSYSRQMKNRKDLLDN